MSRCRHRSEATATRVWRLGQARMSPWGSRSSSSYPLSLSLSIYRCIPHVLKGGRQTAEEFFYQSLLKIIVIIIILILIRPKCPSQTAAGRSSLTSRPSKSALESQMQSLWWIQEGYHNLFDSYCDQNIPSQINRCLVLRGRLPGLAQTRRDFCFLGLPFHMGQP